jgi:hypothetical protein
MIPFCLRALVISRTKLACRCLPVAAWARIEATSIEELARRVTRPGGRGRTARRSIVERSGLGDRAADQIVSVLTHGKDSSMPLAQALSLGWSDGKACSAPTAAAASEGGEGSAP